jgi:Ribbon-helix-helix protein, copG family
MAVRTVRLDDDTEKVLEQLVEGTGLSISALLKQGLLTLKDQLSPQPERAAYEIYEELDLGPGGYAIAPATETKRGVQEAVRRKLRR